MPKKKEKQKSIVTEQKKTLGRPTVYSEELAKKICEVVSISSCGIRKICGSNSEFPTPETIRVWRLYNESFSAQYAKAKLAQADILAEECVDIADDSSNDTITTQDGREVFNSEFAARSRLRIDTRKWLASKLLPKIYGNTKELEEEKEKNETLREEVRQLRAKLDENNRKDY